jgi:CHAP domain
MNRIRAEIGRVACRKLISITAVAVALAACFSLSSVSPSVSGASGGIRSLHPIAHGFSPQLTNFLPHGYGGDGVTTFGDARFEGSPNGTYLSSLLTSMVTTANGKGYWLAAADGGVFAYGDAKFFGSVASLRLYAPIVGMAATPDGGGYWLVGADGGVFAFGDAHFFGSMGGRHLNKPIVGMAASADGRGYWLVASDGGIFSFGNAHFHGSTGGTRLNAPIVGMASSAKGGYWLAAADGGVFAFGNAPFKGSLGGHPIYNSITGIAAGPNDEGYWLVDWGGQVYPFGVRNFGSLSGRVPAIPVTAIAGTPDGLGYWLLAPQDFAYTFSDSPVSGSGPGKAVVSAATSQVGGDPDLSQGPFCNPYGPCEQWCALFATWAFAAAGVPIPHYAFVGDVYDWGASVGVDLSGAALPSPGDAILYGTGPENAFTSPHMGIVAEVWPDGEIITIEGDAGPGQEGQYNVIVNGPFMPADSNSVNGFPVYAYVDPP